MDVSSLRVAVIGVGAIGGPVAAHIAENNIDITVVTKYPELSDLIQNKGLKLQGKEIERFVKIKAVPSIDQLTDKFEIVFLAMKAMDVIDATKAIIPFIADDGVVVTLQNGVVEDEVANLIGRDRVVGAVVVWASTIVKPGVIERTADGFFYIGMIDGKGKTQKRLKQVAELLEYCQPVNVTDNIYGALYTKLGINAAMNGLSAISGLTLGELVRSPQNRHLWMVIATELIAIAKDIDLLQIGTLHPQDVVITGKDSPADLEKRHQLLKTIFGRYMSVKPSTLQSLERNRPSEINYLNGYIARKGKELGIPTPINSKITEMVGEIEAGKRKITPENLDELSTS